MYRNNSLSRRSRTSNHSRASSIRSSKTSQSQSQTLNHTQLHKPNQVHTSTIIHNPTTHSNSGFNYNSTSKKEPLKLNSTSFVSNDLRLSHKNINISSNSNFSSSSNQGVNSFLIENMMGPDGPKPSFIGIFRVTFSLSLIFRSSRIDNPRSKPLPS